MRTRHLVHGPLGSRGRRARAQRGGVAAHHRKGFPLSPKSSSGQTRDGRRKPELSAPGHDVLAARSRFVRALASRSGTSMAAPAVSGLVALIYAEAKRAGRSLTIAELRKKLLGRVEAPPPAGAKWHPRYGRGRASAKAI